MSIKWIKNFEVYANWEMIKHLIKDRAALGWGILYNGSLFSILKLSRNSLFKKDVCIMYIMYGEMVLF